MAGAGRKLFKFGCIGCLGVLCILIIITVFLSFAAWLKVRNEKVEKQVINHEVPAAAETEPWAESLEPVETETAVIPGKVILDLSQGEFDIRPAGRGEPIHVEAVYDTASYEIEETFEPDEGAGWTYRLRFRQTASGLVSSLGFLFGASSPTVRVLVPVDVPFSLDIRLSQGGSRLELGGLWLTSAKLDLSMGGFEIQIDEPLRRPMERFSINGSMGGIEISSLGNASPRFLEVVHRMGGLDLDLRGEWMQDSDISINMEMGGGLLRLPRNVEIRGLDSGAGDAAILPAEREIKLPTLTFDVSSRMGEVEFLH